jgi:nicotinamidase-related amidase
MKSALLIIDVQTALCTGTWAVFDIENVVARINVLSEKARHLALPVIIVQHEEDGEPMKFGSHGWQLYEYVHTSAEDIRVRKTGSDSFYRTELHTILQQRNVDHLIVCGLQSEFCVDSTVRGALSRGYPVTLVADAHTTLDNGVLRAAQISAHHNTTLENLGSYGPRVKAIPSDEVAFAGASTAAITN